MPSLMRRGLLLVVTLAAFALPAVPASAHPPHRYALPGLGLVFEARPSLVVVAPGFDVVPDLDQEVFVYGGWWWTTFDGRWFRAAEWEGPWFEVGYAFVPPFLRAVPLGFYTYYRPWGLYDGYPVYRSHLGRYHGPRGRAVPAYGWRRYEGRDRDAWWGHEARRWNHDANRRWRGDDARREARRVEPYEGRRVRRGRPPVAAPRWDRDGRASGRGYEARRDDRDWARTRRPEARRDDRDWARAQRPEARRETRERARAQRPEARRTDRGARGGAERRGGGEGGRGHGRAAHRR